MCHTNHWGAFCHCQARSVIVTYRTKANLPLGASRVVERLSDEYYKMSQGKPCALPDNITSVSRQGVSWSIADVQIYIDKGLTGINAVDQWISRYNKRGFIRVTDPLKSGVLVSSDIVGCGPDCGDGS